MGLEDLPEIVRERLRLSWWLREANIPNHLRSMDWVRFEGEGNEEAARVAWDLADLWAHENEPRGLALFGKPGVGKSSVLATALTTFIDETMPTSIPDLFDEKVKGYFMTLNEYHQLYLDYFELDRWSKPSEVTADLGSDWEKNYRKRKFIEKEVQVLVIDDVGKEHVTDSGFIEDRFYSLIRGRWARGLSTSLSSNLSLKGYETAYGGAQASFLHEACFVMEITGRDFRRER